MNNALHSKKIFALLAIALLGGITLAVLQYTKQRKTSTTYPFELPALPYGYSSLEPYIDSETMELHYSKHHKKYVEELNKALKDHPNLHKKTVVELLQNLDSIPEDIRTAVRNNGGGHYNHSFFWTIMAAPKKSEEKAGAEVQANEPTGDLKTALEKQFGSFKEFKEQFNASAKKLFGSGWTWLCFDKEKGLVILNMPNQDSPISQGLIPLLCLDLWEHAYYLKYHNLKPDYIDAWWHVVNWDEVAKNYRTTSKA